MSSLSFAAVGAFIATYGSVIMTTLSMAATIYLAFSAPGPPAGPKIGDVRVQTSTYGKVIPIGFGRMRLAGNIIWALDIEEVKRKVSVGGKGGGSQIQYTYLGHFAVGLAEGPAVLCSRIWADKKIIFDRSGSSPVQRKYPNASFRFYTGAADQLPDPLIEADLGVGSTPAFRGRVYMAIEGLPLTDMGNRIPYMEFEVQFSTPTTTVTTELAPMNDYAMMMAMEEAQSGYLYYIRRTTAIGVDEAYSIGYLDIYTDTIIQETITFPYANQLGFGANGISPTQVLPGPDGKVFVAGRNISVGPPDMVQINPTTLDLWARFPLAAMFSLGNSLLIVGGNTWVVQSSGGTNTYSIFFFNGMQGSPPNTDNDKWLIFDRAIIDGGPDHIVDYELGDLGNDADGNPIMPKGFALYSFQFGGGGGGDADKGPIWAEATVVDDIGDLWVCGWADNTVDTTKGLNAARKGKLWRVRARTNALGQVSATVREFDLPTIDTTGQIHAPSLMIFDAVTRTLTVWGGKDPDDDYSVVQFSLDTFTIINRVSYQLPADEKYHPDQFDAGGGFPAGAGLREGHLTYFQNGTNEKGDVYYPKNNATAADQWVVYNAWAFTFTGSQLGPYIEGSISEIYWHKDSDKVYIWNGPGADDSSGDNPEVFIRQVVIDSTETLDVIVRTLISDVNVDAVTDVSTDATMDATIVEGFVVATAGSVRSAINPLGFAYFFDAVESDSKIAFRSRSSASVRTIQEADLGAKPGTEGQGEMDALITERAQETEIPSRVDLIYMDVTRDFLDGNQHAQRMENPSPTQFSNSVASSALPIAMTPDQAKAIAEAKLYDSWAARLMHKFQFGPKHLDLEPTDIVTIGVTGSPSHLVRIALTQIGEAFVTRAEAVAHDPEVLNTVGVGVLAVIPANILVFQGPTQAFLLDIPLLQDTDDAGGEFTGVYVGMGGHRDTWAAGIITKSKNGPPSITFDYWEASRGETPWGYLQTALAGLPDLSTGTGDTILHSVANEFTSMDYESEIKVTVVGGEDQLASVTHVELYEQGLNTAVMVDPSDSSRFEIFQYQNVSISGGVATLTRLLRGQRGSEHAGKAGWGLNTRVAFLDPDITTHKQIALEEIGVDWMYAAETSRSVTDSTRQMWFNARGNDLKPYPVGFTWTDPAVGNRSGSSVTVTGWRRSRLGGERDLDDGIEFIDTGETSLAYEMDLIHKTTGAVDKTYTGVTNFQSGFTVTVTDRTDAGYTNNEAFTVRIYQVSGVAEVGRGHPREVTG